MARPKLVRLRSTMKSKSFGVEGLDQMYDNMERVLDATSAKELKKDFMVAGSLLRDEARGNAPYRTGKLRASIFVDEGDPAKADVLVGVNLRKAPHALLVHYGTSKMQARPFFTQAVSATRTIMAKVIVDSIQKAIQKALK